MSMRDYDDTSEAERQRKANVLEAKIRNMNMTYAELGGILAQDPEDRKGFAEGEEVTYGRASNWLWNALLQGSPYGQMKMWSKILGEADLKKRPRINTIKSKLDEAVSWMDDSFVDPVKEVTSTEWGKKREEARRQEALDQSTLPLNDTDEDEDSGWFGIGRKGRQARRAQRRAERRGARDLETYEEKLAREARDAQRGAEQTQRIQSQSRHRGDAMFQREVEALIGTDSGTEGSRGTRRVMFNEGSLVNVLENLQTAFDTLSAREKIEVSGLLNQKRKGFAEGTQPLTFNQQYHRDTIESGSVLENIDGDPVTVHSIGITHDNKYYNVPSYDRHGGFFSEEEAKKKFLVDIELGFIKGYNTPEEANIAASKEHQMMNEDRDRALEAIGFRDTPWDNFIEGFEEGKKALGLSEGGRVGFADGTPPKDNSWYLGKKIKDLTPAHVEVYLKKVLFGDREPITEKVLDNKEYREAVNSIKQDLLKSRAPSRPTKVYIEEMMGNKGTRFFDEQGELRSIFGMGTDKWTGKMSDNIPYFNYSSDLSTPLTNIIGAATFNLKKGDYNKEKLTVTSDKYDFAPDYGGGQTKPGLNLENIREYYRLIKANKFRTAAERFGMERIPDEKTVQMWEKEYGIKQDADFVPVNISIPVSDIFTKEEWDKFQGIE